MLNPSKWFLYILCLRIPRNCQNQILRPKFSTSEYFVGIFLKFAYSGGILNTCLVSEKVGILGNAHLYNADEYKLMHDESVNFQAYVFVVGSQMKRSVGEFIAE